MLLALTCSKVLKLATTAALNGSLESTEGSSVPVDAGTLKRRLVSTTGTEGALEGAAEGLAGAPTEDEGDGVASGVRVDEAVADDVADEVAD